MSWHCPIELFRKFWGTQYTAVPELAPQRKLTDADDNLDLKNANEDKLMACITELWKVYDPPIPEGELQVLILIEWVAKRI
jgi:hypothetical protein